MDDNQSEVPEIKYQRALLTEREREVVAGIDASPSYQSQVKSSLKTRSDELRKDVQLLAKHNPEIADRIIEAVKSAHRAGPEKPELLTSGDDQRNFEITRSPERVCYGTMPSKHTHAIQTEGEILELSHLMKTLSWFGEPEDAPHAMFGVCRNGVLRSWHSVSDFVTAFSVDSIELDDVELFGHLPIRFSGESQPSGVPADLLTFYLRTSENGEIRVSEMTFATAGMLINNELLNDVPLPPLIEWGRKVLLDSKQTVVDIREEVEIHDIRLYDDKAIHLIDNPLATATAEENRIVSEMPLMTEPEQIPVQHTQAIYEDRCFVDEITLTQIDGMGVNRENLRHLSARLSE